MSMKAALTAPLTALALVLSVPAAAQSLPGEKPADVTAIAGVVAAGAKWQIAWSGPMTADGMTTLPDGDLLFAQEQSNAVWRLAADGRAFAEVPYVLGAGAASVDPQGRVLAVERACTDPGLNKLECSQPSRVMQLTPERRVIAEKFADGASLGRLNDLVADGRGGAWFTQGDLYHAAADGTVTKVADVASFTNGVATSADGRLLYTTHGKDILAFDVGADGTATSQRTFATVGDTAGFGADGLKVDAAGRVYAAGDAGIWVFDKAGKQLGLIPVPRRAITLAFAGPDRRTLYVGAMGAVTPQGKDWQTPQGVRNVAMTVYTLPMLANGAK